MKNDITGDELKTKPASDAYRQNYDLIFRKPTDKRELEDAQAEDEAFKAIETK